MRKRVAVVMAGGSGERFWPLSRRSRPKQFLRLADRTRTLFEQALDNISPLFPPDDILISTGGNLVDITRAAASRIPPDNIIAEPCRRNTTGCLVYAAAHVLAGIGENEDDPVMAVIAADHNITDAERYRRVLDAAMTVAEHKNALVTLGVHPSRPETGYGYIEIGDGPLEIPDIESDIPVYPVARFHEKPDRPTASEYVASGRFFWNSGMFFWRLSCFLRELETAAPELYGIMRDMSAELARGDTETANRMFSKLPDISIDYVLMERARRVLVVEADFGWDDVGSWDALERTMPHDGNGNVAVGDPILVDVRNSIVYNEPGRERMAVAVVGVEGLAVIVSGDAVLVVPKERAQDARAAVTELKRLGKKQV